MIDTDKIVCTACNEKHCYWCGVSVIFGKRDEQTAETRNRFATRDHLIPVSKGGHSRAFNLVIACQQCNSIRGNEPEGWTAWHNLFVHHDLLPSMLSDKQLKQIRRRYDQAYS